MHRHREKGNSEDEKNVQLGHFETFDHSDQGIIGNNMPGPVLARYLKDLLLDYTG